MSAQPQDRMVYLKGNNGPRCITAKDLVPIPADFIAASVKLSRDLRLALDCFLAFGGVPRALAQDVLRNLEPAQAGFDLAVKGVALDVGKDAN